MHKVIQFIVELNNTCNFKCKYCYLDQSNSIGRENPKEMTITVAIDAIEFMIEKFSNDFDYVYVDFLNGEPLLSFDHKH